MKKIHIYIYTLFIVVFLGSNLTYASSEKNEWANGFKTSHSEHPPHDHHDPDHIKKLDEWIRRKRKDEKISH